MKLPLGEIAVVSDEKLVGYCLSPENPAGRHKARVFASALGITRENPEVLKNALLLAAASGDADLGLRDAFGQRYVIDFPMTTAIGTAMIRSAWIVPEPETPPRLISCYVV